MTTPGLRWPASSVTASVSGHVCSASYDPITCSRTALAAPARGTTRARSRGSSAIAAGTSWCRCQGSGTSMISTRILKPAAPSDGRNNCVATTRTVGERLERDRAVLQRLPAIAYDACDKRPGRVSSLSLVRYRGTDYSVPTRFGHCEVLVRGYVHEVVISCAAEVIARHPRSYEQEGLRLRSAALSVLAGAKDQRAGSGGSLGRLAVAAGVRRSPPPT